MGERRWRCSEQCDYHVCRCCFSDLDCIDKEYGPRSDVDCTDNKYVPGAPSSENADDGASESCSSEAYSEASTADSMPPMRFCGRLSEGFRSFGRSFTRIIKVAYCRLYASDAILRAAF